MDDASLRAYVLWMRLRNLSDRTIGSRRSVLLRVSRHAGKPLAEVDAVDLDAWQRSLRMSAAGKATYLSYVHAFYGWMLAERRVGADPSLVLVSPKLGRRRPRPIGADDLELALKAARGRVRVWLLLACLAGLRACEIAAIERADVLDDLASPVLLVHGKGARERVVPLDATVFVELRPYLIVAGRIFLSVDGTGYVTANTVSLTCNRFLHSLGIDATVHQLRHWFGTQVYRESGRDVLLTKELLGHSSTAMVALYAQWDQEAAAPVIRRLAEKAL